MDIIHRLSNRKLYHKETSRYIKHANVIDLVLEGRDFVIYERQTGQDITQRILSDIVVKKRRAALSNLPIDTLKEAIRS